VAIVNEQMLKTVIRVAKGPDGKDFVDDVLTPLLQKNHDDILKSGRDKRDELVGYGNCLKELVGLFEKCDIRLATQHEEGRSWG